MRNEKHSVKVKHSVINIFFLYEVKAADKKNVIMLLNERQKRKNKKQYERLALAECTVKKMKQKKKKNKAIKIIHIL